MNDVITWNAASLVAVAFGVGIVIGLTGMGGGALMTPALIFFGISPAAAVANDLVAASVNKSVGAAVHWRRGSPNLPLAGWLIAGSVPTAFAGAFIVSAVGTAQEQESFLKNAIGVTLLIAASTYLYRMYLSLERGWKDEDVQGDPKIRPLPTLAVGAVGGLCVGITSVGSGSLIMVALLVLYPMLTAVGLVGTDLVQAIPLVLAASISHVIVTGVDWTILIPLIVGGAPGTFLGSRLANRISQSIVRRGITIVLALTGLSMLHTPPAGIAAAGFVFLIVGPAVWGWLRVRHGLTFFEHVAFGPLRIEKQKQSDVNAVSSEQ